MSVVYTLQETAEVLGVDEKRLRAWLKQVDIKPATDPYNQRRRLLSVEEVEYLIQRFRRNPEVSSSDDRLDAQVKALRHALEDTKRRLGLP